MEFQREQIEHEIQTIHCEHALNLALAERDEAKMRSALAIEGIQHAEKIAQEKQTMELNKASQEIENNLSDNHLSAKLVQQLPALMREMPKPNTLHSITMGAEGHDSLGGIVTQLMVLMKKLPINDQST